MKSLTHYLACLLLVLSGLASTAQATDWNVYPGQSIQSAINQSQHGDRIFVHPGTYVTGLRFFGKRVEVIGVSPSQTTILDVSGFNLPALTADAGETYATKVRNIKFRLGGGGYDAIVARVVNSQLTLENISIDEASGTYAPGRMFRVEGGGLSVSGLSALNVRRGLVESTAGTVSLTGLNYSLAPFLNGGGNPLVLQTGGELTLSGSLLVPANTASYRLISSTDASVQLSNLVATTTSAGGPSGLLRGDLIINNSTIVGGGGAINCSDVNITVQNGTVKSSSSVAFDVTGGTMSVNGLSCQSTESGAYSLRTTNTNHLGVWTGLVVNPVGSGGGVRVSRSLNLDGFSIKNVIYGAGLYVSEGSLVAKNGLFENCQSYNVAYSMNVAGTLGRNLVGSAILVPNAGTEEILIDQVDFINCGSGANFGTLELGGVVGLAGSGSISVSGCEFLRPYDNSTTQLRLGSCIGVLRSAPVISGCSFVMNSPSGMSAAAVAVGVWVDNSSSVTVVRDSTVDLGTFSGYRPAIFGSFDSPFLLERSSIRSVSGSLFAGTSGGARIDVVDSVIRFETGASSGWSDLVRGYYSGYPTAFSADRSLFYHNGQSAGFNGYSMNISLRRSRFSGWPYSPINVISGEISQCVFDRVGGPVFRASGALALDGCSFAYVGGVASASSGTPSIQAKNCIFFSAGSLYTGNFTPESGATYSLFSSPTPGLGNITGDPLYADPFLGDYSLLPGSPCIDAGDPNSPLDPDGSRADMGARYQYGMADCNANGISDAIDVLTQDCNFNARVDSCEITIASDCNNDGQLDVCQIAAGQLGDCDADGRPNLCEADCNQNGAADDCDLQQASLYDCNANGLVDSCETAAGTALDCNGNSVPDACDLASGVSIDLNHNGVPDECKPDCNLNNIPDFIEVAYGTVPDCNANLVPDTCEVASGAAPDCNASGVPDSCEATPTTDCDADGVLDSCELANGTEPDCDANQRPDRCDLIGGSAADCNGNLRFDSCELAAGAPDCNGNARIDSCDIASGTSLDLNADGNPDECKPDCNANGIPDYLDVQFGASLDCNTNIVPDECEIPTNPGLDCNNNLQIDSCEVATGVSPDCNGNQLPDACDIPLNPGLDCNGNLEIDSCEVAGGVGDCNGNLRPDTCDLAAGATDCDLDGLLDTCEIAAGAADAYGLSGSGISCTSNGVPDSCEPVADTDADGQPDYCEILAGANDLYGVSGGVITCSSDSVPDNNQPVADCDANGLPNVCELQAGAADCDASGVQDSCEATLATDCDSDGVLNTCELASGAADVYGVVGTVLSCVGNGIPDSCEAAADADADGIPDYCEILAGAGDLYGVSGGVISCSPDGVPDNNQPVADCDVDGVPDFCELQSGLPDCDANGVPDLCQTTGQPALDCNLNGQIDSCELAVGAPDCNGNQRIDSCDIAVGYSTDANNNAVPDDCECATNNFCVPVPNSTGQPALISLVGTASLSLNNASLRCTQLPPTTSGLFFFGNNGLNPGNPFGNGRLCVTGGVRRLPLTQAVAGVVNQAQNFGSTPYAGIQAGDVRFFQFWYRNTAAGGAGFNLSDGIRVTFCP